MIDGILCDTLNVAIIQIRGSYLMNLDFRVWYMINYFRIHKFVGDSVTKKIPARHITQIIGLIFRKRAEICLSGNYEKSVFPKFGDSVTQFLSPVGYHFCLNLEEFDNILKIAL